ncbi:uncharacterized protein LOC144791238 isoform X2 [Lissotriton helveticus]
MVLMQLKSITSVGASPLSLTEPTSQAAGRYGISENSSTNAGIFGESSEATVSLQPSDVYSYTNTGTAFQHSTETPVTNHPQATVNSNTNGSLEQEAFSTAETAGVTGLLSDSLAGGTVEQTTHTSDWVTVSSLPVENTAAAESSHGSLPATNSSLTNQRAQLLPGVTQPEMLRTADGTASPDPSGMSYAEILAIAMGAIILTALVSSLTYQFLRSMWRKKALERTCSVYIIENEMHKKELEVNHDEFETKL